MLAHGAAAQVQIGLERSWFAVPKGGDLGSAYVKLSLRPVGDMHTLFLEYAPYTPPRTPQKKFAVQSRPAEKVRLNELRKDLAARGEVPVWAVLLGGQFTPVCSVVDAGTRGDGSPFVVIEFDGGTTPMGEVEAPHRCP